MLFSELRWEAVDGKLNLQRDGVDATPLEQALSAALSTCRVCGSLHRTCRSALGIDGSPYSPGCNLPKILRDAERVHGNVTHLAKCLAVAGVRDQLDKANPDGVQYVGETANSYVEAIYLAGERQYMLIAMLCRHGVEFDYMSRLHPACSSSLTEPWAPLPSFEEIDWNTIARVGFAAPEQMLLGRVVAAILELPEIDPDRAMVLLEKEYRRADSVTPPLADVPTWNADTGTLSFRDQVIRKVSGQAANARKVLTAFQELNWPMRIDDPLPGGKNQARVGDTCNRLNRNLLLIRFSGDGTGQGFAWRTLDQEN